MIDKGVCDEGFIWKPSNCDCECDKSCDIDEYLTMKTVSAKLVNKLVEECFENIEGVKIAGIVLFEHGNECVCFYTVVLSWL